MNSRVKKLTAAAVAAVTLGSAASTFAAPYVYLRLEGRLQGTTNFTDSLTVRQGDTVEWRAILDMQDTLPATNGNLAAMNSVVVGTDGFNSLSFHIRQSTTDTIQANFTAVGTLNEDPTPAKDDSWAEGSGHNGGTLVARGNGFSNLDAIRPVHKSGERTGVDDEVVVSGFFTVAAAPSGGTGTVAPVVGATIMPFSWNNGANNGFANATNSGPNQQSGDPLMKMLGLLLSVDGVTPGNASLVVIDGGVTGAGGASTRTFALGDLLKGAVAGGNFQLNNTHATDAATVNVASSNGALTTNLANGTSIPANGNTGPKTFSLNANTNGAVSHTLTVSNTANTGDGNDVITVTANVGIATAADSGARNRQTFGNTLRASVAQGGSYAGLSSQTTADGITTSAEILAGTADAAAIVAMKWRDRADDEKPGTATQGPINLAINKGLNANVVDLTGIPAGDVYVLQMSYDDSVFAAGEEAREAANGNIYLVTLNENGDGPDGATGTKNDLWVNAVDLNTGVSAKQLVLGAYAAGDLTVGHYGVDTTNNVVWAVLNHNSQFSVVPEPATLSLLGLAAAGLGFRRRRHA